MFVTAKRSRRRVKLPAVNRNAKDGSHYADLAALARASGFDLVTPAVIQLWVKHGLVPRVQYKRPRFGVREATSIAQIELQLLALCELRFDRGIRSHAELGLCLWIAGWEVDEQVVRASFRRFLAPLGLLASAEARGDLAHTAARSNKLPPRWRHDALTRTALGLETLFAVMSGARAPETSDIADFIHLEAVTSLDRARTDSVGGVDPWLPNLPGQALAEGALGASCPRLLGALERSTSADLSAARELAQRLSNWLAVALPMVEISAGRGAAGFGLLADAVTDPLFGVLLVLISLELPKQADALVAQMPSDDELAELQQNIAIAKAMMDADKALADRAASVGLVVALEERQAQLGGAP